MDDKATAAKIVSGLQPAHRLTAKNRKLWNIEGKQRFTDRRCVTRQIHELESAIVAALEAARRDAITHDHTESLRLLDYAKATKGIIDCTGEVPCVRKVKGTFPITADGVMVQLGEDVWHPDSSNTLTVGEDDGQADHNGKPLANDCTFAACHSYYEHETGYREFELYDVRKCYSTPESAAKAAMEGGTRD
jgi:hypothetical protein